MPPIEEAPDIRVKHPVHLLPENGAVAGWGLHPLESAAFARRTPKAEVDRSGNRVSVGRHMHLLGRRDAKLGLRGKRFSGLMFLLMSTFAGRPKRRRRSLMLPAGTVHGCRGRFVGGWICR